MTGVDMTDTEVPAVFFFFSLCTTSFSSTASSKISLVIVIYNIHIPAFAAISTDDLTFGAPFLDVSQTA
jgi:hypothetical protein